MEGGDEGRAGQPATTALVRSARYIHTPSTLLPLLSVSPAMNTLPLLTTKLQLNASPVGSLFTIHTHRDFQNPYRHSIHLTMLCLMLHSVTFTCACLSDRIENSGEPCLLCLYTFSHGVSDPELRGQSEFIYFYSLCNASCPIISAVLNPHNALESPGKL